MTQPATKADPAEIDLEDVREKSITASGRIGSDDADYLYRTINDLIAAVEALRVRLVECGRDRRRHFIAAADANQAEHDAIQRADAAQAHATELACALEPFGDVDGEGSEDFADDTSVVVNFGRTTHYALTLGDFRHARTALAATPPKALERVRARDEVVEKVRSAIRWSLHKNNPSQFDFRRLVKALLDLDALQEEGGT